MVVVFMLNSHTLSKIRVRFFLYPILFLIIFLPNYSYGYGECSDYGIWATYDYLSGGCKCMSGYVLGKGVLGNTTCVSGNSVCYDKYGYNSRYDSLSKSCECSYGYVFGKDSIGRTQCISENQACQNQYGYNARSTFGGKCECASGYEFTQTGGGLECQSCFSKYGFRSSYDYLSGQCGCDDGYTLKGGQCVEKQNNVYFVLKELDTDNKEAIIRSDYDSRYYFIKYNSGCYSSSFRRYVNDRIVLNLGTDFDLDRWDKIVLQDDNETCDITYREKVDSDFTLVEEKEESYYGPIYIPSPASTPRPTPQKSVATPTTIKQPECSPGLILTLDKKKCIKIPENAHVADNGKDIWLCNENYIEKGDSCVLANSPIPSILSNSSKEKPTKEESVWNVLKFWKWF